MSNISIDNAPFPGIIPPGAPQGLMQPVYCMEFVLDNSFPRFPRLEIDPTMAGITMEFFIRGYGGTDVISLQFNGDNAANYYDRTVTLAAGTITPLADTPDANSTLIRVGVPVNKGRVAFCQISNFANSTKLVNCPNTIGTGSAATPNTGTLASGGEWINSVDPIKYIDVLTAGGANILSGSIMRVYSGSRSIRFHG